MVSKVAKKKQKNPPPPKKKKSAPRRDASYLGGQKAFRMAHGRHGMSAYYVRGSSPSVRRRKVRTEDEEYTSRLLRILRIGSFFTLLSTPSRCTEVTIRRPLRSVGCERGTKRSDGAPVSNIRQLHTFTSIYHSLGAASSYHTYKRAQSNSPLPSVIVPHARPLRSHSTRSSRSSPTICMKKVAKPGRTAITKARAKARIRAMQK
ncbi:hypothetical protein BGY98DRAFT_717049 [Russula aff. rugulosa BPL654]|nr:hypothetical protein BGY98DRAFT_717049 [Russula aff. rugulosa BPL654]